MPFDTHAAAEAFERAGFTEAQVEALIDFTRQTTALPDICTLATKGDRGAFKGEPKTSIAALRGEIAAGRRQAITVILSGMTVITALGTVVSRLMS